LKEASESNNPLLFAEGEGLPLPHKFGENRSGLTPLVYVDRGIALEFLRLDIPPRRTQRLPQEGPFVGRESIKR
jgi:hypothetical protein